MAKPLAREVITLQFGHYANFVGTHLWNLQESSFCYDPKEEYFREINHDCLYREGLTLSGQETFTPRAVLFDLKGSLGTLPQFSSLYRTDSNDDNALSWRNDMTVHRTEPEPKNEFQMDIEDEFLSQSDISSTSDTQGNYRLAQDTTNRHTPEVQNSCEIQNKNGLKTIDRESEKFYDLDKDISLWSDFLGTQFHPKTVQLLGDYFHSADAFDVFGYGQSALRRSSFYDGVEESLHFFVEECDSLQGFQVITELSSGFGGLSSEILQDLLDEFNNKSFLTFGVLPANLSNSSPVERAHRILNTSLSFYHLIKNSNLFAPLSLASEAWYKIGSPVVFPHLTYKPELQYHTSAILAASLDTVTLPFRLAAEQTCSMNDLVDMVTAGGRTVASMATALPIPCGGSVTLSDLFSGHQPVKRPFLSTITPNLGKNSTLISNAAILRHVLPLSLYKTQHSTHENSLPKRSRSPREVNSSIRETMNVYFQNLYSEGSHSCWSVEQACMTKPPFPNIFSPSVTQEGLVIEGYSRPGRLSVPQTSVLSTLSTCTGVENVLSSLVSWSQKINIQKYHSFLEAGTEPSTFKEALESISTLAQRYEIP